jgi:prevent-host-death family protein
MSRIYSTYEAKARFSEVLRQVRAGKSVVIAYRGEPVAEIRPLERPKGRLAARIEQLRREGALIEQPAGDMPLRPIARRPGALKRFLDERD